MVNPINPYIAGNPIRGKGFFGRTDILDWVAQELRNPGTSAIVLFGQRRIGKTTLLLQLQNALPKNEFLPIFFDLQDQARRSLGQVLTDLTENMADAIEVEPPADKIDARGRMFRKDFLPTFLEKLGESKRPIFLMDEFDVLEKSARELPEESAANSLFPFLRQLMSEYPTLAFVFVAGRNPDDLSLDFSATFKSSLVKEIWVLDGESAQRLIRQAEINRTLQFTDAAVERVLALTHFHPYLTQLLCQRIWERAYIEKPQHTPLVDIEQVENAVYDGLSTGNSALQWVWDGLSAAERIYAAALAESAEENEPISEDKVIQVLSEYANRLRTREVELAPRDLVKRRVLEETSDHQYAFAIELFRRWVRMNQPLKSVKNELDHDDRTAAGLFLAGESYFQKKKWNDAREAFEKAIGENPRHLQARLYLAETLLELGNNKEAVDALSKAFELDRDEARLPLARAWVAYATSMQNNDNEDEALNACEAALALSPKERSALNIKSTIWNKRGEKALVEKDWNNALRCFENAANEIKIKSLRERQQQEEELIRHFTEGLGALQQNDWARARDAFQWVVSRQPDFKYNSQKAVHLLTQAVDEEDHAPNLIISWTRRPQNRMLITGVLLLFILSLGIGGGIGLTNMYYEKREISTVTNTPTLTPTVITIFPSSVTPFPITPSPTTTLLSTETLTPTITPVPTMSIGQGSIIKAYVTAQDNPNGRTVDILGLDQIVILLEKRIDHNDAWFRCTWEKDGVTKEGWILAEYVKFIALPPSTYTPTPSATSPLTTIESTFTPTSSVPPTLSIPSPELYSSSWVFDQNLATDLCWKNEANVPSGLELQEGFSRRDDNYWRFFISKQRTAQDYVQVDFSQCLNKQTNAVAVNLWISRLEYGKEIGFFVEDSTGSRRDYLIWLDSEKTMHLRLRENLQTINDLTVLIINPNKLKSLGQYPRPYYQFPIQIFLEIDNEGFDIIYLREGPMQLAVSAETLDSSQMLRIENAILPTIGEIRNFGLIGYGGETQTVIWPLVFLFK